MGSEPEAPRSPNGQAHGSGPVKQRTYSAVIRAQDTAQFAQALATDGAQAAVDQFSHDAHPQAKRGGNLSDHPARDPRRFGRSGAYPRSGDASEPLVERLYDEVGVYGAVVDSWINDTWDDGWTLDTDNDAWVEQVREIEDRHGFKQLVRRADRRQFTYEGGYSLLHARLKDATGDAAQPPTGDVEVLELQVINAAMVEDYQVETEDTETLGDITMWEVDFGLPDQPATRVHPDRVLHLRQQPDDDDPATGTPWAKRVMDDTLGYENTKWAVFEAYFQRASPFLVAEVHEDLDLDDEDIDKDEVLDAVDEIANANTQRILAEGFKLKPLNQASELPDGSIPFEVAQRSISVSARIPMHELFGSAAGELASAQEDTSRYHKRVGKRRSEYAEAILEAWYERLAAWGLTPPVPDDLTIRWPSLDEPGTEEVFAAEKKRAESLALWQEKVGQAPPARLVDYEAGTYPSPDEESAGEATDHAHDDGHGPAAGRAGRLGVTFVPDRHDVLHAHPVFDYDQPHSHRDEDGEDLIPALKPVKNRYQNRVEDVFLNWQDEVLQMFREQGDLPPARAGQDAASADDEAVQALQAWEPDTSRLGDLLYNLLQESGETGGLQSFQQLGLEDTFQFVEGSTELEAFESIADATADSQAEQLTTQIRREVAESLAEEEQLSQTRDRVLDVFDTKFSQDKADLIARTESMRGYNMGAKNALRQAGQDQARFNAFNGACPICGPLDETTVKLGGDNIPPLHPRCRCTITILTDEVTPS
jgi:hypothetical protein